MTGPASTLPLLIPQAFLILPAMLVRGLLSILQRARSFGRRLIRTGDGYGAVGRSKRHRICTLAGWFSDCAKHVCTECSHGRYAVELSGRLFCERGRRYRRWRGVLGFWILQVKCGDRRQESVLRVL